MLRAGFQDGWTGRSPTFYNEGLLFLRLLAQVQPDGVTRVLDQVNVEKAQIGWRNAIRGHESNREPGAKAQARQVVSFLIQQALDRNDAVGELAHQLRRDFPRQSIPLAKTVEPIDLTKPTQ